jgi:hypothetical protein
MQTLTGEQGQQILFQLGSLQEKWDNFPGLLVFPGGLFETAEPFRAPLKAGVYGSTYALCRLSAEMTN